MGLTKYPEGSLKEISVLSVPLMLSSLSVLLMIFADRWLLARYSTEAHNAAVVATTFGWAFIFGWVVLTNIAEVFVAQYNGAGMRERLGEPVWQMIWLSVATVFFFVPLALWGGNFFYDGPEATMEREYFSTMMLFGPFYPLYAALCAFFIGQGKTRLVTFVVIAANIVNVIFDQILIFGIEGWVPSMGVQGAAIGTSLATVFESIVLLAVFFSKKNRTEFGTTLWKIKFQTMWDCVRVGFPNAIFYACEILAFAMFYALMKEKGEDYITVVGICQNMWILLAFFAEGLNKATATIVANLIGSGRVHLVDKVIHAGFKLNALFFVFMLVVFGFGSEIIMNQFLITPDLEFVERIRGPLETCLLFMAVYMLFEGLRYQLSGLLLAAGDTVFLFFAGSMLVWILMIAPAYWLVHYTDASVVVAFFIWIIYSSISFLFYYARVKQGQWRSMVISQEVQDKLASAQS